MAVTRHAGHQRRAWLLVTLACGSWAIGQLIWCYFDVVLDGEVPQVSIADAFFLLFTALMAFAVWPAGGRHADRLRTSLDAFIIGMSLFTISWVTSINQVASTADESDLLGLSINLAYPCGDIVVLTMVLLGALEQHRRSTRPLALLFVDLDDFKVINDMLGHPVGDELVIRVAERFLGATRVSDTVARFGGDEFAVLVEGDSDAVDVGTRLVDCLRPAFSLAGEQLLIGASIGIAEVRTGQPTPPLDELYSRADIAMYAAKRSGKGQLALYEPSMVLPEAADLHYRPLLIEAIRAGTIECFFQPIMDLTGGRVHSMEALARWRVGSAMIDQDYFIKLTGRLA